MLFQQGLMVALTVTAQGILIEGPDLADRLLAREELRKLDIIVVGHVRNDFSELMTKEERIRRK